MADNALFYKRPIPMHASSNTTGRIDWTTLFLLTFPPLSWAGNAIVGRLAHEQRESEFLRSLAISDRLHIIDPSVLLGPIGAVRAAQMATVVA